MTVHQLRYTGDHATVFQTGNVGLVEPGDEFAVPDELLLRFMRRPDVSHAVECPAPPCRCGEDPQPEPEQSQAEGNDGDSSGTDTETADHSEASAALERAPDASDSTSRVQEADTSGAGQSGRRGRSSSPTGKGAVGAA